MSELPLVVAFASGTASAVNPCGFALLPGFVSYFLGSQALDGPPWRRLGRAGAVAGQVTLGFLAVFGLLGLVISAGSRSVVRAVPWLALVAGVALVVWGVALLAGRSVTVGVNALRRYPGRSGLSLVGYGAAYGVASAGCTLPVFLVVVVSALAGGGLVGAMSVFAAYAVGMGVVLLAVTVATAVGRMAVVRGLRRLAPHLEKVSGVGLVLAGGYLVHREVAFLRFSGLL